MIDVLDGWYPLFCIKHVCKSLCTWYYIYVFVKLIVYKLKMKKLIYIYIYVCLQEEEVFVETSLLQDKLQKQMELLELKVMLMGLEKKSVFYPKLTIHFLHTK